MREEFENIPLVRKDDMLRFEMVIEKNMKAIAEFEFRDGKMFILHVEVPKELQGQGAADAITEKILIYLEDKKIALVPMCPFVIAYLHKHPEWKRILLKGLNLKPL